MTNEETTEPSNEPTTPAEKTEEEGDTKPLSPNERAEANITAMKAENDRMEKNILAQQEMRATDMLGGTADAGQAPIKKAEETPEDYAKRALSGEMNVE